MSPRILVIDDEDEWREQFRDILEITGYDVDTVENFDNARDSLRRARYDLVLLDIRLDQTESYLAFQKSCHFLRQQYPDLPVVATSGRQIDPTFMFRLRECDVVDFVSKSNLLVDKFQQCVKNALIKKEHSCPHLFDEAHALLIGVGSYVHPRFASLPVTVRDAEAIAAVLKDPHRCGYSSGNVGGIVDPDATADSIRAALDSLARSTDAQSTAFVYFSGHGGRALENSQWRAYLCPREADPDDLARTAISGDEFSALLAAIPARKLLVMLDACHAAGSAELKSANGTPVWKAGLPDNYYEALSHGSGRVVIASSKENQYSFVRKQGDLSLFTWHLREALGGKAAVRGDGLIHVLDVFHYVNEAVQADEPKQTPILKVKDLDLNFPIALDRGGKGAGPTPTMPDVAAIREQIVHDPLAGAKALSAYLATHPEQAERRNEVDLKRADLERIQHDLELFGPNPGDQAAKNRTAYFLLRACLELEQRGQ